MMDNWIFIFAMFAFGLGVFGTIFVAYLVIVAIFGCHLDPVCMTEDL